MIPALGDTCRRLILPLELPNTFIVKFENMVKVVHEIIFSCVYHFIVVHLATWWCIDSVLCS